MNGSDSVEAHTDHDRPAPRRVELRGLTSRDQPAHAAHLLRLSDRDRRARFHATAKDAAIEAYSRNLDWHKVLIFGLFVDGTLRGVGELLRDGDEPAAEISLSVESPWQRDGFGKTLLLALVLAARRVGITELTMSFLSDNISMRALSRDLGAVSGPLAPVIDSIKTIPMTARQATTGQD
ncbi:GNAT family N-acetyltransferase [Paracoccus aurantiacus]|uniref:GNAT family N-acetyltransferase n=1 Tax=Paracoccus aurantiacus TaxID=2599412 RepID=A0A5C6S2X7_9RHOB|nr:GNAT family N-acetyltransferase [Paracoccus aurantiacus]TXB68200.1 GNAT family N-acetyltransferase [Paracoccus aurantiacus]